MAPIALAIGAAFLVSAFFLHRASRLPERRNRKAAPLPDTSQTRLAQSVRRQALCHPRLSGVYLLEDGIDAFAARLLLIQSAERRLDVQYYIWHGDRTGTLLLEALRQAADRGVRVRLLLDDNGISGLDAVLAALDRHPNVEIRLFNPFPIRFPKALGFLLDFRRLNRRMHNKSLTVDGAVTIVGGRNIGDEYFDAGDDALFVDVDVLAVGPIVADVERDFERYWDSQSVYPADQILHPLGRPRLQKLITRASIVERDPSARRYVQRVETLPLVSDLLEGTLEFEWAVVSMISDEPAKGLGRASRRSHLLTRLEESMGPVTRELGLVSGYFVPGSRGARYFADLAASGVSITVLTNGYAAADVSLVHAGYAPYRHRLVAAGVRLLEMRPQSGSRTLADGPSKKGSRIGVASRLRGTGTGSFAALRAGATTLHAKTFTVDRERLFVGSFNLDPRSFRLNTELGFVIESPALASRLAEALDTQAPQNAYEVLLGPDGKLIWKTRQGSADTVLTREPGMNVFDRLLIALASRLPISGLL
ncbi:phospholipase D family protein [Jiella marina]|uniref:phospholipase D family protein n=1 Tax=Jiella sp. LLJ827 TaxID=2917712 RepID=UPI0021010ACD|nr:phospholipase D family protein [Jiella sp. LLJ827]MCQ0986087.1 phospholipase D family protein [Jiella sp. LLJ827]